MSRAGGGGGSVILTKATKEVLPEERLCTRSPEGPRRRRVQRAGVLGGRRRVWPGPGAQREKSHVSEGGGAGPGPRASSELLCQLR